MRTRLAILICAISGLAAVALVIVYTPKAGASVSVTLGGFETNRYRDDSLYAAVVAISNGSPVGVSFDATYQTRSPSGWLSPSAITTWHSDPSDDLSPLQPFSERVIHVPVPTQMDGPWRVVVRCTGPYKGLSSFQELRLRAYLFVFRREPARFSTSNEQSANQSAQPMPGEHLGANRAPVARHGWTRRW